VAKDRNMNPVVGDDLTLKLYVYNSNSFADVQEIRKVEIWTVDKTVKSESNPDGLRVVEEIEGAAVANESTGVYSVTVSLEDSKYTIGKYADVWYTTMRQNGRETRREQYFQVFPDLWYTSPMPIVYDFSFNFQPNSMALGNKKPIMIQIEPNVPKASDLAKYYENLVIGANVLVSMRKHCGPCLPQEEDLRLVLDEVPVEYKDKNKAFLTIDTEELGCGTFDVWFKMEFGGFIYISDPMAFQVQ
jgi:hypothetical protein